MLDINIWNFNEMLTNDVVSFEQPGPELGISYRRASWNYNFYDMNVVTEWHNILSLLILLSFSL